jgi:tetratricopeptide (TPR) repeat protein
MTRATLSWIAAILIVSGSEARAAPPREPLPAARPFVEAGVAAYKEGDYETAIRNFSAAYQRDPQPAILYAWAQALRQGRRCADAIAVYRRYLATDPNEAQIAAARHGISLCEKTQPLEPDQPAPAPEQPGAPASEELAPAGVTPPVAPIDAPPRRWYRDPLGGALVIGGAVSLGVGAGFLVRSSQNRGAAGDAVFREEFVELLDTATLQRRLGVVGLGVGAALVTAGIVRYVTQRPRDRGRAVSIAVAGRSLVVAGRF